MSLIVTSSGRRRFFVSVVVVAGLAVASRSEASVITWSAAQNILSDADVSTTGTLVAAFNLGGPGLPTLAATTVNGVLFNPFAVSGLATTATSGNFTFVSPSTFSVINVADFPAPPFSSLSASYQALLSVMGPLLPAMPLLRR